MGTQPERPVPIFRMDTPTPKVWGPQNGIPGSMQAKPGIARVGMMQQAWALQWAGAMLQTGAMLWAGEMLWSGALLQAGALQRAWNFEQILKMHWGKPVPLLVRA